MPSLDTQPSSSLLQRGSVGIVYVPDVDIPNRLPFTRGCIYYLVKKPSTAGDGEFGAQLIREGKFAGWIRKGNHFETIMKHLDNKKIIFVTVVHKREFSWNGDSCFWGIVDWEVINVSEEELMNGNFEGLSIGE
ncbi:hypothetical protein DFP73DRAFT_598578 [Morchella snyderi]|nr:hypothetical protein DFP73DRAFT_598578 [Morchella snyderi]